MPYLRHRRDTTHASVVEALWRLGWTVWDTSQGGQAGAPDLVIAKAGRVVVCEVKSPTGKLRPAQATFLRLWPAEHAILRGIEDVLALEHSARPTASARQVAVPSNEPRRTS